MEAVLSDVVWIPACPEPFYVYKWFRPALRCECGRRFTGRNRLRDYRAHWRLHHDLDRRLSGPYAGVTHAEAQAAYAEAQRYG